MQYGRGEKLRRRLTWIAFWKPAFCMAGGEARQPRNSEFADPDILKWFPQLFPTTGPPGNEDLVNCMNQVQSVSRTKRAFLPPPAARR